VAFEILHFSFMLFGRAASVEGAQISAFACLGICFSGVETILAGFEFADHYGASF
jgi:hypothetical protein